EPTVLFFGRATDCRPKYPYEGHRAVSRHHCLVEINPPDVRLRDLGSLHGTYVSGPVRDVDIPHFTPVNDLKLGGRADRTVPDPKYVSRDLDLGDGAEVRLTDKGQAAFRVHVPARCAACGAVLAEGQKSACARPSGAYLCPSCRLKGREA